MSIFNYKIDPFYTGGEDVNTINNTLNSKNFSLLINQNLTFNDFENAYFVKQSLDSNISLIELNNETLNPTDMLDLYIISSLPNEQNIVSVSLIFNLKPNEIDKIIVYAFSIMNSPVSQNLSSPIFNGKELIENQNETQFDFKGKEYLSINTPGKLNLNYLRTDNALSIYYCVTDLNLKNSSKIVNVVISDYYFIDAPNEISAVMAILISIIIMILVFIMITGINRLQRLQPNELDDLNPTI